MKFPVKSPLAGNFPHLLREGDELVAGLQDLWDQLIRYRFWLQPPHRPDGPDDLEQVGSVRGRASRSVLGHALSRLNSRHGDRL